MVLQITKFIGMLATGARGEASGNVLAMGYLDNAV